jgi:signal transduction histidine kinase
MRSNRLSILRRAETTIVKRRIPSSAVDISVALLLLPGGMMISPEEAGGADLRAPDTWRFILVLLMSLAFAFHRRHPGPVSIVVGVAVGVMQVAHYIPQPVGPQRVSIGVPYAALAVTVLLAAARSSRREATILISGAIPIAALAEALMVPGYRLAAALTIALLLIAAWALGRLHKARKTAEEEALQRVAAVERERAANTRAALVQERAIIAREVHDIIAHNVSLMVVQTIAADRIQDRDGEKAHELHRSIETIGRTAVSELRGLLGVLRTDEGEYGDPAQEPPQPTLDEIPRLIAAVRAAGLDVHMEVAGIPGNPPAVSQLAAYRIVQEALTNTLKHAGGTQVTVSFSWSSENLEVRICDEGRRAHEAGETGAEVAGGAGHGLIGMKERIAAVRGTFYAGERPGGGFCVHVTIPIVEF